MDPEGPAGVVWLVGPPGSGRETVARDAARTLMLPLAFPPTGASAGATLEMFPDQGTLTAGLADMLRGLAADRHRIALVPVTDISDASLRDDDFVVPVLPLDRTDFHRLVTLVLQGDPTHDLVEELHRITDGLPGAACRELRRRLEAGDLTWTPDGVDAALPTTRRARMFRSLATLPFALIAVLGAETGALVEAGGEVADERWRHPVPVVASPMST